MTPEPSRLLRFSDIESRRFGLTVVRGIVPGDAPPGQLLHDIIALRPDVAIFRCDAGNSEQAGALLAAGLIPIHADTLVYYRIALGTPTAQDADDSAAAIRPARPDDEQALAAIVRRSFTGYRNHYHANPRLAPDAILDGYVEWALDHAIRPSPEQDSWVYCADGEVRGFATCRRAADGSIVDIVLNAIDPAAARQGYYGRLLKFLITHYRQVGVGALEVSTQVWNYSVQRIWARTGLVIDRAYDTWHVNVPRDFIPGAQPCR